MEVIFNYKRKSVLFEILPLEISLSVKLSDRLARCFSVLKGSCIETEAVMYIGFTEG